MKQSIIPLLLCAVLFLSACAPQPAPTAAPTALPEPTATPIKPTPTPDPYACLNGDWLLNTEQAAGLLAYLTSQPSLTILEGGLRIRFEDGVFAYHSDDLFLRTSFLDGFLDARARVLIEGDVAIDGDRLTFTQTNAVNELYDWRAVDSMGEVQPFYTTSPVVEFNIATTAAYNCSGDNLSLIFEAEGLSDVAFELTRVE